MGKVNRVIIMLKLNAPCERVVVAGLLLLDRVLIVADVFARPLPSLTLEFAIHF